VLFRSGLLNGSSMPVEGVELTVFFACPYIAAM
jgi:hypothetical protein